MLKDLRWEKTVEQKPQEPWRKILLDAADLIERRGWCKGTYATFNGGYCAIGAMMATARGRPSTLATATRELQRHIGVTHGDIPRWNDQPTRTKDEVISALRAAAER